MTRRGFLPQVTMRISHLGQNGDGAPAPSPAPSADSGDNANTGDGFNRFPFFPTFFAGPSYPYYQQPYYPPAPARPRYICKRTDDEDGDERFICEPETPPAPPAPIAPYYPRTPVLYVRPYGGSWYF